MQSERSTSKGAHPRSRGENEHGRATARERPGSSPLTRGKRRDGLAVTPRARLIPAHAGKTVLPIQFRTWRWAHPRSRGENAFVSHLYCVARGSSPLTRGKHNQMTPGNPDGGLIPAHAGKTEDRKARCLSRWAHPRSRGENLTVERGSRGLSGSSPLTRGKPVYGVGEAGAMRLIPAHAGKTP